MRKDIIYLCLFIAGVAAGGAVVLSTLGTAAPPETGIRSIEEASISGRVSYVRRKSKYPSIAAKIDEVEVETERNFTVKFKFDGFGVHRFPVVGERCKIIISKNEVVVILDEESFITLDRLPSPELEDPFHPSR